MAESEGKGRDGQEEVRSRDEKQGERDQAEGVEGKAETEREGERHLRPTSGGATAEPWVCHLQELHQSF